MFSPRGEECPGPPMTRSERIWVVWAGDQEGRRGWLGGDLPNRLYDMVVVFW